MQRKIGIPIKDIIIKDGKVVSDTKAVLAKLPINKRIAATKSKRIRAVPRSKTT